MLWNICVAWSDTVISSDVWGVEWQILIGAILHCWGRKSYLLFFLPCLWRRAVSLELPGWCLFVWWDNYCGEKIQIKKHTFRSKKNHINPADWSSTKGITPSRRKRERAFICSYIHALGTHRRVRVLSSTCSRGWWCRNLLSRCTSRHLAERKRAVGTK